MLLIHSIAQSYRTRTTLLHGIDVFHAVTVMGMGLPIVTLAPVQTSDLGGVRQTAWIEHVRSTH